MLGQRFVQLAASPEPVEHRHRDVHQRRRPACSERQVDRFAAVLREPDDLEALVRAEDRLQRRGEERVVVGDQDANLGSSFRHLLAEDPTAY